MIDEEGEKDDVPEPTNEQSGTIKPIGKDTVHRICSGQVVLSLAIAIKELVENAIDAGATLVGIKLCEQGLESIEVCDNGSGVLSENLEAMTAKYHTSKLREFVDLEGVKTFGFRGEALSSLCALSDMMITTRHTSADIAMKVELDHEGSIKTRIPCARCNGTTVTLTNLFVTLPVRRRDFCKNIKREFIKMCQILQAYCLVCTGVRIICTNQTAKGDKNVVMQTHGATDILSNISAVFGMRQVNDVMPIKSPFCKEKLTAENLSNLLNDGDEDIQITDEDIELLNAGQFQLIGYISNCAHGAGRSSRDRQFFFVNSRPCEPKNIAKVVNDVYHRYNPQQFPFVFLNILISRNEVDVNLTPDKRQLFIYNEKILLLAIKKALINTFDSVPSTFTLQNSSILSMFKAETVDNENSMEQQDNYVDDDDVPTTSAQSFANVLSQWKHTGDTRGAPPENLNGKRKCSDELAARTLKMQKIHAFLNEATPAELQKKNSYKSDSDSDSDNDDKKEKTALDIEKLNWESLEFDALTSKSTSQLDPNIVERIVCKNLTPANPNKNIIEIKIDNYISNKTNTNVGSTQPSVESEVTNNAHSEEAKDDIESSQDSTASKHIILDDSSNEESESQKVSTCELRTTVAEIEVAAKAEEKFVQEKLLKSKLEKLRFKSEINPNQNKNAEDELQREIGKESFARMEILGQFNLGFIIVKLDDDLFIIDQHASDEKYNFEMLQRTTVLQYQKLAIPQSLEMTAVNEMVLLDHLDVFEKNGFKFEIDENAPPTKKFKLLGKPTSKNWEFGKDDIDELLFMLQDAPEGTICRPTRIRAMFASRACRKSFMIGKALNMPTMKSIVQHMGEIEQPWNCPHGRPTMRHLINTAMLLEADESDE